MASYNTKGSLQEKKTRSEVLSFTFALLIRPWTQNGIMEGVRRKSLISPTNFWSARVRIGVKDATPLMIMINPVLNVMSDL